METKFKIGDSVKYSEMALRPIHDLYHRCGSYETKSAAKRNLKQKQDQRGKIINILNSEKGIVEIEWENGQRCQCFDYLISPV